MDILVLTNITPLVFLYILLTLSRHVQAKVTVTTTAPMANVDEGGILSVHCEVSNLQEGQRVTLVRQTIGATTVEDLTSNDLVQTNDDERVFLAVRQLPGNTKVYFLSIIEVRRSDQAKYSCRVTTSTIDAVVISARDSVDIKVNYFPDDTNPKCTHNLSGDLNTVDVQEGDMLTLNCTSARGNPMVSVHWMRSETELKSETHIPSGSTSTVSGILRFQATRHDDKSIFMCQIRSQAFPGSLSSCHIGPLTVRYESTNVVDIHAPVQVTSDLQATTTITSISTKKPFAFDESSHCKDVCSLTSGPGFYWVISTIIVGCLALLFLIIGCVLLLKYCRMTSSHYEDQFLPTTRQDDFYEKLQYGNTREEMVYMSLGNSNRMKGGKGNNEVHYCLAPNKASYVGSVRPLTE
ncbi:uncharacterized protein [Amphiura filiformis]|uniref:uncharacterized protein n=1 Tax=Amphiura filiformis TaxID=82378 RepID=UPI003B214AF4